MLFQEPALRSIEDERFRSACALIRRGMRGGRVPGVAVGIWADDVEQLAGLGVSSVEHRAPVTPRTVFQIGSITKTFTATLALRLEHKGLLDLDIPIRTYLPRLRLADRAVARAVTMRQLLMHSAGFEDDYFQDYYTCDDALAHYVAQLHRLRQVTPLGEIYGYCNAGYCLAGRVIEVVTRVPFEQAMREWIFDPLELTESFFSPAEVISRPFAVGHWAENGQPAKVARPWDIGRAHYPAGGIACSVHDLLRWARFNLGDAAVKGRGVLPRAKLRQLQTPALSAGVESWIGLGWHLWRRDGLPIVEHAGGTNGQIAQVWLAPKRSFACAIVTNSGTSGKVIWKFWEHVAERYLGQATRSRSSKRMKLTPEELAEYAGRYTTPTANLDLTIEKGELREQVTFRAGSLDRHSPPPRRLAFYERDRVFIVDGLAKGMRTEFLRDQQGRVRWYRSGGRTLPKET
jgi:CubicO group peptidase (beta-lactamase class C family)